MQHHPQGQFTPRMKRLKGGEGVAAFAVVDAGEAEPCRLGQKLAEGLQLGFAAGLWHHVPDQIVGVFAQDPGRLPGRVAVNLAAGGVGRLVANPGQGQGTAVHPDDVPILAGEEQRSLRGQPVEGMTVG